MSIINKFYKIFDSEIVWKNLLALKYKGKEKFYHVANLSMPDPIFIIGCSRAGTTVTFETIRQSPALLSFPYEIPQFWHSLFGPWDNNWHSEVATRQDARPEHRDKAFAYFYARLGKGQVLDKSCINILRIPYLHALFPNGKFIFIQRDGRDNISSLIDGWQHNKHFSLKPFLGEIPASIQIDNGQFTDWSFFLPPSWRDYNHASLEEVCAHQWLTANQMALDAKELIPEQNWVQIRYEDLFESPVEMFQAVFEQLELPFTDAIKSHCAKLNKRPTSIVNGLPQKEKWKSQNPEAISRIMPKIEPMLKKLGYL
ncbi:MAG: sulfotransferase [Methyloprofundus sp.]|nr:sulfotransferase [Methyloprofundus sp.]